MGLPSPPPVQPQEHHARHLSDLAGWVAAASAALWRVQREAGTVMWRPRPKTHMLLELLQYVVPWHTRNPRIFRCYIDEDSMRRAARVAGSCHVRTVSTVALNKVLLGLALRWAPGP